jgi:hypothetical protein
MTRDFGDPLSFAKQFLGAPEVWQTVAHRFNGGSASSTFRKPREGRHIRLNQAQQHKLNPRPAQVELRTVAPFPRPFDLRKIVT